VAAVVATTHAARPQQQQQQRTRAGGGGTRPGLAAGLAAAGFAAPRQNPNHGASVAVRAAGTPISEGSDGVESKDDNSDDDLRAFLTSQMAGGGGGAAGDASAAAEATQEGGAVSTLTSEEGVEGQQQEEEEEEEGEPMDGEELRLLVFNKWGKYYDTRICQRRDRFNKLQLYLQVMWKFVGQKSFPMTEQKYMEQLDAVASLLTEWGVTDTVRRKLEECQTFPKMDTTGASAVMINLDIEDLE